METVQETSQLGTGWIEFSERHARAASSDFARSVVTYFNSTYSEGARHISHKDLLKKFVDCFSENFEYEFHRRNVQQGNSKVSFTPTCDQKYVSKNRRESHDSQKNIWELPVNFRRVFPRLRKFHCFFIRPRVIIVTRLRRHNKLKSAMRK